MKKVFFYLVVLLFGSLVAQSGLEQWVTITKTGEWGTGNYNKVSVNGNYAYCAAGTAGMDVIDISTPGNPRKIGNFNPAGIIEDLDAAGNYVYAAAGHGGFLVIDSGIPTSPLRVGTANIAGYAASIRVKDNYAYVLSGSGLLTVVDVTIATSPLIKGCLEIEGETFDLFVSGNHVYIAAGVSESNPQSKSGLHIIDVSDPAKPSLTTVYDLSGIDTYSVCKDGDYAYLSTLAGFMVLDVSDPASPKLTGQLENPGLGFAVRVKDGYAFQADSYYGVRVFDISDPSAPVLVTDSATPGSAFDLEINGDFIYVADYANGLQVMDISTPTAPEIIGYFDQSGDLHGLQVAGGLAYAADFTGALQIIDVSSAVSPKWLGSISTAWAQDLFVSGNYAYIADGEEGIKIIDISQPANPVQVGAFDTTGFAEGVYVQGGYAYVADYSGGMRVLDVSGPASPSEAALLWTPGLVMNVTVQGNYAYMAVDADGLVTVDISDPTDPELAGHQDTPGFAVDVHVEGNYAYVADSGEGLQVIDISNPASPTLTGSYDTPGTAGGVYVSGQYAYVADGLQGLQVVDISNPAAPALAGQYNTPGYARQVRVKDDYIYVTDGEDGKLLIFRMESAAAAPEINLDREQLYFGSIGNSNTAVEQVFHISNSGSGNLVWSVSSQQSWISPGPTSGTNSGEVTVSVYPAGLEPGTYIGAITVSAPLAANSPQIVNVLITVYAQNKSSPPFGVFATPVEGAVVNSSVPFTGWVLDDIGVQRVQIMRTEGNNLVPVGDAVPVEGARPDVELMYPDYPQSSRAGWGYMMLTNFLPPGDGEYTFHAVATDLEGHETLLGTRTVTVDNANAVKPFGTIETPAQGGAASGRNYVNFGWVLTPPPNTIPIDGSTITVWIDGVPLGNPVYNQYRKDIAELFPGYNNSDGAIGFYYMDTTQYANGVHTISWSASDDAGNKDGIGSRYFTIKNSEYRPEASRKGVPAWAPGQFRRMQSPHHETNQSQTLEIPELQPVKINLGKTGSHSWSGYLQVGNLLKPLPIGSTLDHEKGIFYWSPGPGFIGRYDFVFIEDANPSIRRRYSINIHPRHECH